MARWIALVAAAHTCRPPPPPSHNGVGVSDFGLRADISSPIRSQYTTMRGPVKWECLRLGVKVYVLDAVDGLKS